LSKLQYLISEAIPAQICHVTWYDSQQLQRYGYLTCSLTWKLRFIYLFIYLLEEGLYSSV